MTELSQLYKNHYIFNKKNQGASRTLKGNVVVIVFYINDGVSGWTDNAIERYRIAHDAAMLELMQEALESGARLNICTASCQLNVNINCTVNNTYQWIKAAMSGYGKTTAAEYQRYYEKKYGYDEAPILFAFNKEFRSFAQTANIYYPTADEYSAVARNADKNAIKHELLHQFGACDLYYPEDVKNAAMKHLPDSIMNIGGSKTDPLTRYLIGWESSLKAKTEPFLNLTKHHTYESIQKALTIEWKRK